MDKIAKIKAEIERRMDILYPQLPDASKVVHENISLEQADITGKYVALESLLSFIDKLPEEPVSEDLEEAAKIEAERFGNCVSKRFYFSCWLESCFKAGAKWQKQRAISKACYFLVDAGKYMRYNAIEDCYSFNAMQLSEDYKEYMEESV